VRACGHRTVTSASPAAIAACLGGLHVGSVVRIQLLGGISVETDGRPATGAAAQPRRLALLAAVACAGEAGIRRERLVALFWPDADEERGRAALKQALYALRRDLGGDSVIVGQQVLQLDPESAACDVVEFRAALAAGRLERAAELYGGPLLDGFRLPNAEAFDRWLEDERRGLARTYAETLDRLAAETTRRGDVVAAVRWWRALAAHDPLSAHAAVGLMEALAAAGDVGAALRHARVHATLLAHELDLPPDEGVAALEARLRSTATATHSTATLATATLATATRVPSEHEAATDVQPSTTAIAASIARRRPWRLSAVLVLAVLATIAAGAQVLRHSSADAATPVLAVGRITAYRADSATTELAAPLADMLATNLARTPGLRVISSARMYTVLRDAGGGSTPDALAAAGRRAGATELVEGTLTPAGGALRLDLRRVDLATGRIVAAGTVVGRDPFALVDSGTAKLVGSFGRAAPVGPVAAVTTRSVVAYRLYAEGIRRAFHDGDWPGAQRLFDAAAREDSTFAMAVWWAALLTPGPAAERAARFDRAIQLADHTTERERLVVRANWATYASSPMMRVYADSLLARYPDEVEGHLYMGIALRFADEYAAAIPQLERAVVMDSAHVRDVGRPECYACQATLALSDTYLLMDSLDAAEQAIRRWIRLDPRSARAWRHLSGVLEMAGRGDRALDAWRTASTLDPTNAAEETDHMAEHWLRARQYARVRAVLEQPLQGGNADQMIGALWWLGLSERQQGQVAAALRTARRLRALSTETSTTLPGEGALLEAQMLMDAGQYRASAALYDSIGRGQRPFGAVSNYARNRSWMLAHAADALALAGDTAAVARLVDSVAYWGRQSILGRDQRMHHHVRGLLLAARGDDEGAVREFRAAMRSPNLGYARTNYALALALLRLHRPLEAVRVLQPLFHAPVENSNTYLSLTEVHALLSRAWAAAGNADSAAAHRRVVTEDWAHADAAYTASTNARRTAAATR